MNFSLLPKRCQQSTPKRHEGGSYSGFIEHHLKSFDKLYGSMFAGTGWTSAQQHRLILQVLFDQKTNRFREGTLWHNTWKVLKVRHAKLLAMTTILYSVLHLLLQHKFKIAKTNCPFLIAFNGAILADPTIEHIQKRTKLDGHQLKKL